MSYRVIVAGSRTYDYPAVVDKVYDILDHHFYDPGVDEFFPDIEIVSGLADGPDKIGKKWAELNKIPVKEFPADWKTHGKKAGILRNEEMGNYADALIAFWDGKSRGTKHMIDYALKKGLKEIHVYKVT